MEHIPADRLKTFSYLAPLVKWGRYPYLTNTLFDIAVAHHLKQDKGYKALIGWSGMSIRGLKQARQDGKTVVIERGSSHIGFQIPLLEEEYSSWGFEFKRDNRVMDQEFEEYDKADYITIPSDFVRSTFIEKGISPSKLFKNNFGSNSYFKATKPRREKFTILYVGNLSLRKGLPYLFEALNLLECDPQKYDVWFVGSVQKEIEVMLPRYRKPNWKFYGHINHYQLADVISPCSVAVHPSLEEGLSMVIPQLMFCGVPVIATTNTGGADIITDGGNGVIVPIRSPEAIAKALTALFEDRRKMKSMQAEAMKFGQQFGTWDNYGDRYAAFLRQIVNEKV
jgi:glycosyltransferase involved in cell wall biosynthesis